MLGIIIFTITGLIISIPLVLLDNKLKKENNKIEEYLPGYNCGGCGNPGCSGMAEKIVDGTGTIDQCKPCKADMKEAILKYVAENCRN